MKRFIALCLFCILGGITAVAQEGEKQYLFPEFQKGQVLYKDGRVFNVDINYSLISNRFVFIDTHDENIIKEFGELDKVGVVKTGERIFTVSKKGEAGEIVQEKPRIIAEYRGKVTDQGKKAAYGGRSQTSSIDAISSFQSGGLSYRLEGDDRWVVSGIDKKYQVEYKNKMRNFSTPKQFTKIYPKEQTAAIEEFIKTKKIDFNSVEQVIELCNYADSLN